MATLPLHYCYGRSVLQTHLLVGGSVFFDDRFTFPRVVFDEVVRQSCTGFAGVPLTFETIQRQLDAEVLSRCGLRYITQAGGRMRPETIDWVREAFAPAELFVMYGQTEATARLSYLPPARAHEKRGSVGVAVDNVELAIVDDDGCRTATGDEGHVVARGPSITPGYFQAPEDTAEVLRDGWLYTGDRGYLDDDGFLFLVGRSKDFLKLRGNRVSALEIEELVATHPAVAEVAVVGTTDQFGAEQAVAFVVVAPGAAATEPDIRRHCRAGAPLYKVPRFVRFVDWLPRTSSNKIAKPTPREWFEHGQ
jgi:acyl-CoA synthetase (AMP-forming)/AMP-acid ligase II